MIPVVLSPLGIPVRPVEGNSPAMRVSPNGLGIPIRISDLGAPFVVAGLVSSLTVTGGTITPFSRDGVDYVEVLFTQSGSFTLSGQVEGRYALAGGGGNGGRSVETNYTPGGGGAGRLIAFEGTLVAGNYSVNIGAGAPANVSSIASTNGALSSLEGPTGVQTAPGGGGGGSYTVGGASPKSGGSGGGGRSGTINNNTRGVAIPGSSLAGLGNNGGLGFQGSGVAGASGGGGGAGGAAPDVTGATTPGAGGQGVLLDWIAAPTTVCSGGSGLAGGVSQASASATWGGGSQGALNAIVGAGGDGFLFLRLRADHVDFPSALQWDTGQGNDVTWEMNDGSTLNWEA